MTEGVPHLCMRNGCGGPLRNINMEAGREYAEFYAEEILLRPVRGR